MPRPTTASNHHRLFSAAGGRVRSRSPRGRRGEARAPARLERVRNAPSRSRASIPRPKWPSTTSHGRRSKLAANCSARAASGSRRRRRRRRRRVRTIRSIDRAYGRRVVLSHRTTSARHDTTRRRLSSSFGSGRCDRDRDRDRGDDGTRSLEALLVTTDTLPTHLPTPGVCGVRAGPPRSPRSKVRACARPHRLSKRPIQESVVSWRNDIPRRDETRDDAMPPTMP